MPQPTAPQPDPPAPPSQPTPPPTTQTVPYDRFSEVNAARQEAEKRAQEAEKRAQELEDAQRSELEKAQAAAAREKARADAAEQRLQTTMRDNAIRAAAMTATDDRPAAIDADAVVALLGTGQYGDVKPDDPASATAAIAKLAEAKPTLFAAPAAQQAQPQAFGFPAGAAPGAANNGTTPEPESERASMGTAMLSMLRGKP